MLSLFPFQMLSLFLFPLQKLPISSLLFLLSYECVPAYNHPQQPYLLGITLGYGAFKRPSASPPIDALQVFLLLHIQLETWVPPCVLFGCLVTGSSGGSGWLMLFFLSGHKLLHLLQSFSNSFIGEPMFNPLVVYEHSS